MNKIIPCGIYKASTLKKKYNFESIPQLKRYLSDYNYSFEYDSDLKSIKINKIPTIDDQIEGIVTQTFDLTKQINRKAFAAYLIALDEIEDFCHTPMAERQKILKKEYGIEISEATLYRFQRRLKESEFVTIEKDQNNPTWWWSKDDGAGGRERHCVNTEAEFALFEEWKETGDKIREEDPSLTDIDCRLLASAVCGRWYYTVKETIVWNAFGKGNELYQELKELYSIRSACEDEEENEIP